MKEIKTKAEFTENNNGHVLLKIGSSCCGPCKMVEQTLSDIESSYPGVKFLVIDADECDEDLLDGFNVRNIPTLIYFRDGVETERTVGLQTKEQIKEKLG